MSLEGVSAELKPLISLIWPEKFEVSLISNSGSVMDKIPFGADLLVMFSGGVGSTAALWNVISRGRDASVLFVEGGYPAVIEKTRGLCIKKVMLEARGDCGKPLTSDQESGYQTWLSSFRGPKGMSRLCRKARIAVLTATTFEAFGSDGSALPSLIWGSVFDCIPLLEETARFWPFQHVVMFSDLEKALFSLTEAEAVSEKLKVSHPFGNTLLHCGPTV